MRTLPAAVLPLLLATMAPGQGALFLRQGDLARVQPATADLRAAVLRLLAGPTPAERAAGLTTALPPGVGLVALTSSDGTIDLVLDAAFLRALVPGYPLETALEQLIKTVLGTDPAPRLVLHVREPGGAVRSLHELLAAQERPLPAPAPPRQWADGPVQGALTGRTIAISPGHGYYWHSSLGWTTQRPLIDGLIEDIHNGEISIRYLIPALENLGARVICCRERGEIEHDRLGDNDLGAPSYVETGSWATSLSTGYGGGTYRYAGTASVPSATATWQLAVPRDGIYPVYVSFRAGSNRARDAHYRIEHTGGVAGVERDQTRSSLTWVHLGDYYFAAANGARITLTNESAVGGVVIADAVRIGGGMGSIARGAGTSGKPRWQEAARYWTQFAGAPASVYNSVSGGEDNSDDVTARPRYAEWRGADAYLSLHSNAGGGTGTSSFIHSTSPTAGSASLQQRVHDQLIADIRARYEPSWVDRGKRSANFGEVRLLSTMPGVLIELAFHDTAGSIDHRALHDPVFRRIAGEAMARGLMRYFAPTAPFPPQPPTALRVVQDGAGGLRVAWDAVPGAAGYTVEQSPDGKGFLEVAQTGATSWSTGPLPHHDVLGFRVRATNASGRSFPTEVLTAGCDHRGTAELLLVQGFDRLERSVKYPENTFDYLRLHGDAIRRDAEFSLGFDAASNEAVKLGRVALANYRAVDWACGEESTQHDTFDAAEQFLVQAYLAQGGSLLVSGAEIGWDLVARGTAAEATFYRSQLGANYVADDAQTYGFRSLPGGIFAGLPAGRFDDGRFGTYDVDWPDVIAPGDGNSTLCLQYDLGGQGAAIQRIVGNARVVNLGFPLETVTDGDLRAAMMRRILRFLLEPMELTGAPTATIGTRWHLDVAAPSEAGRFYLLLCSDGLEPPLSLPGGAILPLRDSFLIPASVDPGSAVFGNFVGTLDGTGSTRAWVDLPNLPFLRGLSFYFSGLTTVAPVQLARVLPWARLEVR